MKYTGRANELVIDGRRYRAKAGEDENGKYGSFDHVQISKTQAANLAAQSRLHSFEDAGGDVLDQSTAPPVAPADTKK